MQIKNSVNEMHICTFAVCPFSTYTFLSDRYSLYYDSVERNRIHNQFEHCYLIIRFHFMWLMFLLLWLLLSEYF